MPHRGTMFVLSTLLLASMTHSIPLGILKEIRDYYTGFPPLPEGLLDDEGNVAGEYDFVIIGAGSGGSVLANRLTEVPEWRVLLIEAGKDEMFLTDIPLLAPAMQITAYNWGYRTEPGPKNADGSGGYCLAMVDGRCNWPRGKAVGGTSVINFMIHARGTRADYDDWAKLGNPGWSYDEVLPYFLKSENARIGENVRGVDRSGRYHSENGYLDVTTSPYVSPLREPFLEAGEEIGYRTKDCNDEDPEGFCVAQANLRNGRRVSASKAFLRPVRHRRNLHLSKLSKVTRIVINPVTKEATGVEFLKERQR